MRDNGFITAIIVVLVIGLLYLMAARVDGAELPQEIPEGAVKMHFTCYCPESCKGRITASGEEVREGIIAASKDHMGDYAEVYLMDGTLLGLYQCLDTGGNPGIQNGHVIDVWAPHLTKAKILMRITGGECYVRWY